MIEDRGVKYVGIPETEWSTLDMGRNVSETMRTQFGDVELSRKILMEDNIKKV